MVESVMDTSSTESDTRGSSTTTSILRSKQNEDKISQMEDSSIDEELASGSDSETSSLSDDDMSLGSEESDLPISPEDGVQFDMDTDPEEKFIREKESTLMSWSTLHLQGVIKPYPVKGNNEKIRERQKPRHKENKTEQNNDKATMKRPSGTNNGSSADEGNVLNQSTDSQTKPRRDHSQITGERKNSPETDSQTKTLSERTTAISTDKNNVRNNDIEMMDSSSVLEKHNSPGMVRNQSTVNKVQKNHVQHSLLGERKNSLVPILKKDSTGERNKSPGTVQENVRTNDTEMTEVPPVMRNGQSTDYNVATYQSTDSKVQFDVGTKDETRSSLRRHKK